MLSLKTINHLAKLFWWITVLIVACMQRSEIQGKFIRNFPVFRCAAYGLRFLTFSVVSFCGDYLVVEFRFVWGCDRKNYNESSPH
jgi:hypothetical protein